MSGQSEHGLDQPSAAATGINPGVSRAAVTPEENEPDAQADPSPRDAAGTAASALPRRIVGSLLPVMAAGTIQPQPEPELLRRVLDGLKKL